NILRTHLLRPTWHFVLPEDIRWLLKLTAPKIKVLTKYQHQKRGMDNLLLKKSKQIITKALTKEKKLTRIELMQTLNMGKINTKDGRITFYLLDAELDGLICSGGRIGKQFAYTLLDRIPTYPILTRDESITELAKRYFLSRGPATVQDFSWWSGLNITDAKKGILFNKDILTSELVDRNQYWFSNNIKNLLPPKNKVYMLPAFDEYALAYKDRSSILAQQYYKETSAGLKPLCIASGKTLGMWRPYSEQKKCFIELHQFNQFVSNKLLSSARKKYFEFIS
ncbi:MAG TPA: winged helix DNA-binding domain-containing protein, partial [Flavisolibacter sp.]|nr:winged helix DNA-binding domain-containing protein [Flavisolibacter sp.]